MGENSTETVLTYECGPTLKFSSDMCTWACSAAGEAGLAGPVGWVMVVPLRTWGEAAALPPQVDEAWIATQAAILPAVYALTATWVALLTHPRSSVSIVTRKQVVKSYVGLNSIKWNEIRGLSILTGNSLPWPHTELYNISGVQIWQHATEKKPL